MSVDTWTIKIDGVDRTSLVDVQSIRIQKTQGFRRDEAQFAINGQTPYFAVSGTSGDPRLLALPFQSWQVVEIYRNDGGGAVLEFGGFVMLYDGTDAGTTQDNLVTCVDWSALLDARITDGERKFTSQSAGSIVQTLMAEFVPEINVSLVSPGETIGEIIYDYAIMADVIRGLAQLCGYTYYVKVDPLGTPYLYFQIPNNPVAPFKLSTTPDEPEWYPFRVDNWATEGTEVRNSITVQYVDGTITREDAASQALYGYELAMMAQAETADATSATLIANGLLEAYKDEMQSGTVTCWQGGLTAGMLISVKHVPLGIDDDYIIQQITIAPAGEKTIYQLQLGDKHTGLIDRLRQLGGGNISSSGNVTGKLFVGRREGPHVGLFRTRRPDLDYNIYLQAVDTGNQPFFNVGAIDYATNGEWLSIGYPDPVTGKTPIRLAASATVDPAPEAHPALEIDAAYLVNTSAIPGGGSHAAVTLAADADTLLGLTGQQITLDTQTANTVFAGPTTGAAADPTFRALVAADIGADLINDTHIDWGTGATQVSAADVPIADAGNYYTTDTVEAALQQIGAGGGVPATRTVTGDTTETATDDLIVCNKATAMTVTLLAATGSARKRTIANIGAGVVTVDGDSSETINGETTQVLSQGDSMTIRDYTSGKWVIV